MVGGIGCFVLCGGLVAQRLLSVQHERADINAASDDLDKAVAEYRAQGFPWVAADLLPNPPLRESDNAAPVIEKAISMFDKKAFERLLPRMGRAADSGDFANVLSMLKPFENGLKTAESACRKKGVNYHRDWDLGPGVMLPELGCYKDFVKGLCLHARYMQPPKATSQAQSPIWRTGSNWRTSPERIQR